MRAARFWRSICPILALIAGTAVGLLYNFTGSKYFAFKRA
jgi:hypothetical protein